MTTSKKKILHVDDSALICKITKSSLTTLGYDVDEANSGREALKKLFYTHYDLLISDFDMPEMTGLELLQELRSSSSPNAHIPVVMITGGLPPEKEQIARQLRLDAVLKKPYNRTELSDLIAKLLR